MTQSLAALPPEAPLWTFVAERTLDASEASVLLGRLRHDLASWASHGRKVASGVELYESRILIVGGWIEGGGEISGCGIDSMTALVTKAASELRFGWLDGLHVVYRERDGTLAVVPRATFREAARRGLVSGATIVVDTTIGTRAGLTETGLERPAADSWHGRVFRLAKAAAETS